MGIDILCGIVHVRLGGVSYEVSDKEWALMQFTGTQDRNRKEIYEGDVYKTSGEKVYKVMFVGGAFVGGTSEGECQPLGWEGNDQDCIQEEGMNWLEVIGNIYENPDLVHNSQK